MKRILALVFLAFSLSAIAAPNSLFIDRGTNSNFSANIRPAPTYVDALVLVAGTAQTQVVPANSRWVLFSSSCGLIYVNDNAAATVPGTTTTTGAASELNPAAWNLTGMGIATISVISPLACVVTMSFYL